MNQIVRLRGTKFIYVCLQLSSSIAYFVWKPRHFEFRSYIPFNKLTSIFLCVCPAIDHEFRHNIVKVAVDPRRDSRVDQQPTEFIVNNKTDA